MKKTRKLLLLTLLIMLFVMPAANVSAASLKIKYDGSAVSYKGPQFSVTADGTAEKFSTPGIQISGTNMVSAYDVFKTALGGSYSYTSSTGKIVITCGDNTVQMNLGSTTAYVNGTKTTISVSPKKVYFYSVKKTKIYVPAKFLISEAFGYDYAFDSDTDVLTVKTGKTTTSSSIVSSLKLKYDGSVLTYKGKQLSVAVNGTEQVFSTPGIQISRTNMVSAKDVFQTALGGTYSYTSKTGAITISYGENTVLMKVGSKTAYVNGTKVKLSVAPRKVYFYSAKSTKIYVPVKFVASDALGLTYSYDSSSAAVSLTAESDEPTTPTGLAISSDGSALNYTGAQVQVSVLGSFADLSSLPGLLLDSDVIVPARAVFADSSIGASYSYDASSRKATLVKDSNTLVFTMGSSTVLVNGKAESAESPAHLVTNANGTSYVCIPASFTSLTFGYSFEYDESTSTVLIGKGSDGSETVYKGLKLYYDGSWHDYTGTQGKVSVDGTVLDNSDMPSIIIDNTALLRAKQVFGTAMGCSYTYDSTAGTITIANSTTTIIFTLGISTAVVNGVSEALDTAPRLVKNASGTGYTMVPGRFTANALGYSYTWSSPVSVISTAAPVTPVTPVTPENPSVSGQLLLPSGISYAQLTTEDLYLNRQFTISMPGDYTAFYQSNPFTLSSGYVTGINTIFNGYNTVITIQTSKVRAFTLSDMGSYVTVTCSDPKSVYKKIIVLDPGHGGSASPGATVNGIEERYLTYNMMYTYTKDYFASSDIKVYYTRDDDSYVGLYTRASLAEEVGADYFISLHLNYADNSSANGTEVYYCSTNNDEIYNGMSSYRLAKFFEASLPDMVGMAHRTNPVRSANYVVIKYNSVPSILIELGYMSNSSDFAKFNDPTFQQATGKAIYDMVVRLFQVYPTNR